MLLQWHCYYVGTIDHWEIESSESSFVTSFMKMDSGFLILLIGNMHAQ